MSGNWGEKRRGIRSFSQRWKKPLRRANSSDSIKIQETLRKYPPKKFNMLGVDSSTRGKEEKERGNRDGEHVGFRVKGDHRERKADKTK